MKKSRAWIQFLTLVLIATIIYISPISKNSAGDSLVANAYPPPPTPNPTFSNPQFLYNINLPLIISGPPPAPAASLSRYMGTISSNVYTNLGCLQAQTGLQDAVVILDFGDPRYDGSPISYGTYLKNYNQNVPATIDQIEAASKAFLTGYHNCHLSGTQITLGIGTTNEGAAVSSNHGIQWAQMIIRIDSYISSPPSWADHEAVRWSRFFDTELG